MFVYINIIDIPGHSMGMGAEGFLGSTKSLAARRFGSLARVPTHSDATSTQIRALSINRDHIPGSSTSHQPCINGGKVRPPCPDLSFGT